MYRSAMSAIVGSGSGAGGSGSSPRLIRSMASAALRRACSGGGIAVASQRRSSRAAGTPALDHVFLQARGIDPDAEAR